MPVDTKTLRFITRVLCKEATASGSTLEEALEKFTLGVWESIKSGGTITSTDSNNTSVEVTLSEVLNPTDLADACETLATLIEIGTGAGIPPEEMCAWVMTQLVPIRAIHDDFTRMVTN